VVQKQLGQEAQGLAVHLGLTTIHLGGWVDGWLGGWMDGCWVVVVVEFIGS